MSFLNRLSGFHINMLVLDKIHLASVVITVELIV